MGMTYDEFWHGPPSLVKAYRKAYDMKRHERNQEMWLMGRYVFDALRCAPLAVGFADKTAKPGNYPDRPYPLSEQEAETQNQQREEENFKEYLRQMEAASERELNRRKQAEKEVGENG